MKHVKFLAFMLAMIAGVGLFASCSSSDDDDDKKADEGVTLVGTWTVTSNSASEPEVGATVTFKADGHLVITEREDCQGDSWKVEGDKLLINLSEHWGQYDDGLYGSFAISGNTATYRYNMWNKYENIDKNPSSFTQTLVLKKK